MVAIADGKPQQMGLLDIIRYYVAYQREVVLRRTKFDLDQAKERCHILEGLIIAVRNIDEVIEIIKTSESVPVARQRLRERFDLSERQAQAILDLRLARLTKLEIYKLEQELEELKKLIARLTAIVESKKLQMEVVKEELQRAQKTVQERAQEHPRVRRRPRSRWKNSTTCAPPKTACWSTPRTDESRSSPKRTSTCRTRTIGERSQLSDILRLIVHTQTDKLVYSFTNMGNCYKIDLSEARAGQAQGQGRAV